MSWKEMYYADSLRLILSNRRTMIRFPIRCSDCLISSRITSIPSFSVGSGSDFGIHDSVLHEIFNEFPCDPTELIGRFNH